MHLHQANLPNIEIANISSYMGRIENQRDVDNKRCTRWLKEDDRDHVMKAWQMAMEELGHFAHRTFAQENTRHKSYNWPRRRRERAYLDLHDASLSVEANQSGRQVPTLLEVWGHWPE